MAKMTVGHFLNCHSRKLFYSERGAIKAVFPKIQPNDFAFLGVLVILIVLTRRRIIFRQCKCMRKNIAESGEDLPIIVQKGRTSDEGFSRISGKECQRNVSGHT